MNKLSPNLKIAVLGLYHLGSVVSISLASLKQNVVGVDFDKNILKKLNSGKAPLYEPGLEQLLKNSKKYITFTDDFSHLKDVDIVYFAQDTETGGSGSIEKLKKLIALSKSFLKSGITIIIMSQVPVGFHRSLLNQFKKEGGNINLYHLVDTVIMTSAIDRFLNPERIIIGMENKLSKPDIVLKSFLRLFKSPVFYMSYESAELTKAAINLYLSISVTYANTLADFCESLGGNIHDIIPALQSDKRIGLYSYIHPNLRISGGHLERDLLMLNRLADHKKIKSGIVGFIIQENEKRYKWIGEKLKKILPLNHKKKTICIWGLSYKKNSQSTENAPSLFVIKSLFKKYIIKVYDPKAIMPKDLKGYKRFDDKFVALKDSDVLIILNDWEEFKKANISKIKQYMKSNNIIDCPGIMSQDATKEFNYYSIGLS